MRPTILLTAAATAILMITCGAACRLGGPDQSSTDDVDIPECRSYVDRLASCMATTQPNPALLRARVEQLRKSMSTSAHGGAVSRDDLARTCSASLANLGAACGEASQ